MLRDNPIHSLFQVLTGQIHDQLALGGYDWLTVVMAWVLFLIVLVLTLIQLYFSKRWVHYDQT